MGVIFLEHIGGTRLFSCASCDTNLTNRGQLISTRFTGATGRAFLFNKVVNLNYRYRIQSSLLFLPSNYCYMVHSEVQDRVMLTGRHMVRDVSCKNCDAKLGWVYEFATDDNQRYKEGRVILERALVTESDGMGENI
ncbi:protein yippee-like 5 [Vespula maculifrons]|uniref:Protein yippee-like n=1 Tax=Vespula maculifrons TaxID=7453 RepID=A0ABD2BQS3_VESMC